MLIVMHDRSRMIRGGRAGVLDVMHGRSRMAIDPRILTMPGRGGVETHSKFIWWWVIVRALCREREPPDVSSQKIPETVWEGINTSPLLLWEIARG